MTRTGDVSFHSTRALISRTAHRIQSSSVFIQRSRRRGVKGFETYYHSPYAAELAQNIQNRLCSLKGAVNRGVHTADFSRRGKALYPAVLWNVVI